MYRLLISLLIASNSALGSSYDPDWSEGVEISEPRSNPYNLDDRELTHWTREGLIHALWYPVPVTGLKIPFRPIEVLSGRPENKAQVLIRKMANIVHLGTPQDIYEYMGLDPYPEAEGDGAYYVPFRDGVRPSVHMAVTLSEDQGARYVTASCTACHAETLFGKPVLGLPNKTPRAYVAFHYASEIVPRISDSLLHRAIPLSAGERSLWKKTQKSFKSVELKTPLVLGLDTSLAIVELSLAKRERDPDATISNRAARAPRPSVLSTQRADSKPMPWFLLKYKNRWLSDGSVVSGNPVLTNILWNEIGRGVHLPELVDWIESDAGRKAVAELTTAVFNTKPPRYTDFFGRRSLSLERAQSGQRIFRQNCLKCHGDYVKGWETNDGDSFATVSVDYPKLTEVKDVGTDPWRWKGMESLAPELNRLGFSEKYGIKVIPQKGYVPPPLVGVWSRWPYFHNNSAPTLCDVLREPSKRATSWYVADPVDPAQDFDQDCNGFPSASKVQQKWRTRERRFDTSRVGMSNVGHWKKEFSDEEIKDLVMFLQTL
jgi:mono/diheme cytochrome c family protein